MAKIDDILAAMRRNPKAVSYRDLCLVCDFGKVHLDSKHLYN